MVIASPVLWGTAISTQVEGLLRRAKSARLAMTEVGIPRSLGRGNLNLSHEIAARTYSGCRLDGQGALGCARCELEGCRKLIG